MPQDAFVGADTLRHARQTAQHYLAFAFFNVFVNLLMLTGPFFMLQIYDRVLGSRSEETLVALALLVTGLYGFMWMLDFARGRLAARYGARLQTALGRSGLSDPLHAAARQGAHHP